MNMHNKPFGGIAIIGMSNFCQMAPVVSGADELASLAGSVKSSPLWIFMRLS
ncbi:hypothetical protein BDR04DRAFT_1102026 [Suillus decipiens]|nr:hypothetical protein BDR04DRAFT_1102026 [Suillus decipiens]